MGILDRISTILRANINVMLDEAENPEVVLDQIIRDMSGAIGEARGQVAEMIALEKLLENDYERNHSLSQEWADKAEMAVRRGAEDLAREALRRKMDYEKNATAYRTQLEAHREVVGKLRHDLGLLESKYNSSVRNRDELINRHRRAVTQQRLAQTVAQLDIADPTTELSRMEQRIRVEEARASAATEIQTRATVEDQFEELESSHELDFQLENLRAKVRGELPADTGQSATTPGEPHTARS